MSTKWGEGFIATVLVLTFVILPCCYLVMACNADYARSKERQEIRRQHMEAVEKTRRRSKELDEQRDAKLARAHEEGHQAAKNGVRGDANPYIQDVDPDMPLFWMSGWIEEIRRGAVEEKKE